MRQGVRAALVAAWVGAAGVLLLWLSVLVGATRPVVLVWAQAFAGQVGWVALPAAALALAVRRRLLGAVAGVALACQVGAVVVPHAWPRSLPPAGRGAVRVWTANLAFENRRVAELARQLIEVDADVLALQEVTPAHLESLRASGLLERYPHHVLDPREGAFGSALLSRLALEGPRVEAVGSMRTTQATVCVGGRAVRFVNVHPPAPRSEGEAARWRSELASVRDLVAASQGLLVVVGDFNATLAHGPLRSILRAGMSEAHRAAGRDWTASWPQTFATGPLIRIDHVLHSPGLVARGAWAASGAGSDHRPVGAELGVVDRPPGEGATQVGDGSCRDNPLCESAAAGLGADVAGGEVGGLDRSRRSPSPVPRWCP